MVEVPNQGSIDNHDPMSQSLNLVFCGTPAFAVPTLERLAASEFAVRLVATQPDRPRGRGLELAASPVKQKALELGLRVTQPEKIKNNEEFRSRLTEIHPDAIIVVGYGRIVPQWMIDLPPLGNINLHASLLPKYRGAAPIQWAIASGESTTGVTTMRIDAGLDTGDILLQRAATIGPNDTAVSLAATLAGMGAGLMIETLRGLENGAVERHPQDPSQASLAPMLKKEDGRIDFHLTAAEISNRWRGFQPWPGAYTTFRGKILQLVNAAVVGERCLPEGELRVENDLLIAGCRGGAALALLEVQPEGKKRMRSRDFIHGYRPQSGEKLGN